MVHGSELFQGFFLPSAYRQNVENDDGRTLVDPGEPRSFFSFVS